jgi:hypothetical protein
MPIAGFLEKFKRYGGGRTRGKCRLPGQLTLAQLLLGDALEPSPV